MRSLMLHDAQVMRDEQVGQAELLLEVLEEVDDLPPDRHVKGGDRLVADDELGVQVEGAGNTDPLALAAGELVRVASHVLPLEAHHIEQIEHAGLPLLTVRHAVDVKRLPHDMGHVLPGVERGEGS